MAATSTEGTIELGVSQGVLGALGEGFLEGFCIGHPGIHINHREANDVQVDMDLRLGDCALELVVAPYQRDIRVQELYCCPMCLWMRVDDPLAEKDLIRIEDLAGRDIAMPGVGFKSRDRLLRAAGEKDVELGTVFQMSEAFRLYQFAASGRGLSFTLRHLRENPVFSQGGLVTSVPVELVSWSFGIACMAGHELTAAEQAFWDWCVEYGAKLPRDACCNKGLHGICTRIP